jgi:hypothetical protein
VNKLAKIGRGLTSVEHLFFSPYFESRTLYAVRIFEGSVPFWLHKNMCAVVIGSRIYFRSGIYQANTPSGIELLAHELTHVEQYLSGMTIFKYLWASRHGYRRNPYEVEAYAKGAYVRQQTMRKMQ